MKIDLQLEDLIIIVNGCVPYYSLFNDPIIKPLGAFTGGHVDKWDWNMSALTKLNEEQLWTVYQMCIESWK